MLGITTWKTSEERAPHVGPLQGIEPVEVMVGIGPGTDLAGRVDHDIDTPERVRLREHPFDVELVGNVSADRERGPNRSEDLLDDAVGCTPVSDVADDHGVAPVRELAHDLPADTREPPVTIATRSVRRSGRGPEPVRLPAGRS